jgi:predicted RNase H-like nuclease (RuvC/YqgF family)
MITVEALQTEVRDLKRRLDLTETRVTQMEGRFEFVAGQLRDIQLYMHAKFADMEKRDDRLEQKVDRLEQKVDNFSRDMNAKFAAMDAKFDALPRVLVELLAKR